MELFNDLFELASVSKYANSFADSKKVETRVLGFELLNPETLIGVEKAFRYLKRVSFKLDDAMNCFVQYYRNELTGKETLWFNVVPAPVQVPALLSEITVSGDIEVV